MGSAVGLTTRLCSGVETTYGTPVTPDRFLEFESETLERKNQIIRSNALGSGSLHLRRGSRSVITGRSGEGTIAMEVVKNGMGRLLRNLIGGTPTIAQQGGTAAYLQTHTMGTVTGQSLTVQKQKRDSSDTVVSSFTFEGCKYTAGEFKIDKKGKLMVTVTVDAEDVNTSTPAATPSLTPTTVFHYQQGGLTVGGVPASAVESCSIKFDRKLDTDRFFLGNSGVKAEPTVNDFPAITGALVAEFAASTYYDLFAADTGVPLVLTFTGGVISGTYHEMIQITVPEVHFTGETPKTGGPGLIKVNMPFEGQWDGSSADLTVLYQSTDTAF